MPLHKNIKVTVGRMRAKRVFVSTKFGYINDFKPAFKSELKRLMENQGFIPIFGDPDQTPSQNQNLDLENSIAERIVEADAFLQIIPQQLLKGDDGKIKETEQSWLLYELGIARGLSVVRKMPIVICVDEQFLNEYPTKVGAKWLKFPFNSAKDTKDILKEIKKALDFFQHTL